MNTSFSSRTTRSSSSVNLWLKDFKWSTRTIFNFPSVHPLISYVTSVNFLTTDLNQVFGFASGGYQRSSNVFGSNDLNFSLVLWQRYCFWKLFYKFSCVKSNAFCIASFIHSTYLIGHSIGTLSWCANEPVTRSIGRRVSLPNMRIFGVH